MGGENSYLKWNNYHHALVSGLNHLLERELLCDVTLVSGQHSIKVHSLVLSACSGYFEEMFSKYDKPAVLYLNEVSFANLTALVDFMYRGEVVIAQEHLKSFIKTAKVFGIRGLIREEEEKSNSHGQKKSSSAVKRQIKSSRKSSAFKTPENPSAKNRLTSVKEPPAKKLNSLSPKSSIKEPTVPEKAAPDLTRNNLDADSSLGEKIDNSSSSKNDSSVSNSVNQDPEQDNTTAASTESGRRVRVGIVNLNCSVSLTKTAKADLLLKETVPCSNDQSLESNEKVSQRFSCPFASCKFSTIYFRNIARHVSRIHPES